MTRELERRWEKALQEQREVEEEYDRFRAEKPRQLTAIDRRRIKELAKDIPALWRYAAPRSRIGRRLSAVWWSGSPLLSEEKPNGWT